MVTLLYFAWVREAVGLAEEHVALPKELTSPRDVATWLATRGGGYEAAFTDPAKLRCAVNQNMVAMDAVLDGPHEIAFFPPVTGG